MGLDAFRSEGLERKDQRRHQEEVGDDRHDDGRCEQNALHGRHVENREREDEKAADQRDRRDDERKSDILERGDERLHVVATAREFVAVP